jgi:hypothetical protein
MWYWCGLQRTNGRLSHLSYTDWVCSVDCKADICCWLVCGRQVLEHPAADAPKLLCSLALDYQSLHKNGTCRRTCEMPGTYRCTCSQITVLLRADIGKHTPAQRGTCSARRNVENLIFADSQYTFGENARLLHRARAQESMLLSEATLCRL